MTATGPYLGIIGAAGALIALALWLSLGASAGRDAASAILQAQRDISAVQEVHVEVDPAALRVVEADLLTATTAFNHSQYETATEVALRASRTAQELLASRRFVDDR